MAILRFIVRLPFFCIRMFFTAIALGLKSLFFMLRPLLGKVSWQSPQWTKKLQTTFNQLEQKTSQHAFMVLSSLLVLCIFMIIGQYAYLYQQNKPKPIPPAEIITKTVEYTLVAPEYPDISQPELKQSILLSFSDSAAPIDKIDTTIDSGIQLTPEIKGVWKWEDQYNLRFTADEPFVLGQKYRINFAAETLLADNVKLSDNKEQNTEFYAPAFYTEIMEAEIGTSSRNADQRNAFFTLYFPTPVDKKSFEAAIKLEKTAFKNIKNPETSAVKYEVRYNEDNPLIAYIQSEELPLEAYENTLTLEISDTVKGDKNSLPAKTKVTNTLNIPNQFGLNVESVQTDFVEKDQTAQRLLIVNFNDPVDTETATQSIKVWLLPKNNEGSWSIEQVRDEFLTQRVTLRPIIEDDAFDESEATTANQANSRYAKNLAFNFDAPENRMLYIQIESNSKASQSGYRLKKPVNQLLSVTPFEPKLQFTSEGTILPLKGSKTLDITARNVNGMQVELFRLRPNQLQHFLWQNNEELDYWNNSGTEDHFTDYFTQFVNFTDQNRNDDYNSLNLGKTAHHPLDITPFLAQNANHPRGIFLIKLRKWDGKNSDIQPPPARNFVDQDWIDWETYRESNQSHNAVQKGQVFDQRIIVVTDIGIITKRDIDQSWHVFANSISENKPLSNAKISVIAKNGAEILHALSDETGHVHFPSLANFTDEKEPSYFLVESLSTTDDSNQISDFSFLPVFYNSNRQLDFSRFDIGGEQQSRDPKSLNSYLFSDRGIYRPGDTFNIGIITRTADWSNQLSGIPLIAVIYDARYQEIKRQPIVLDGSGFNELSFTTSENASTGEWRVELYLPGKTSNPQEQNGRTVELNQDTKLQDAKLIGYVSLNVKEFEPDRLKVNLNLSPKSVNGGWVKPDELTAQVNVNTLFGTPAQNRRVTANLSLRPTYPHFARYNEYHFYENAPNRDGISEELAELSTDEMGIADINMSLNSYEAGTYQLNLLVEAFEAGAGRSVAATAHTLISPYDYLIGFKAPENLEFINQNAERHINLIAINSSLEQIPIDSLSLELFERKYLSVLTQQYSGAYKYESKLKETLIKKETFAISAIDSATVNNVVTENVENDFNLDTEKPGDYVLVVKNKSGQTLNRIYYSVAGNADITRDLTRNSELKVKLDKTLYKPGDKMQISINAPYSGTGLITIERDKVYSWQWFHSDTTNSIQTISLPELPNFEGNAYVTVQFIRDTNSPEIFMSPLSYAAIPFELSHDARTANVTVTSQERIKSGDVLSMTVKTDSPQKVVVFAVDEGILQVARYRLKDPLDYFFQKRALEVKSAQILDLILPEYQQLAQFFAAAGGDGSEALDQHLNPFKRKRDKPVAFWSGIQDVDGEKTFTYQLPEYYNGKVRVMAISVTPNVIGHSQSDTIVKDDIVLLPNSPATVAPEDSFDVSMSLTNTLNDNNPRLIKVKLTPSSGLSLLSEAQQTIELKSQQEGMLNFRLQANQQLGNADLTFSIEYIDQNQQPVRQSRTTGVSIRPITPYRSDIRMGRMRGSEQDISDLRTMYPNYARNQASVSFSPLLLAKGLNDFLNESTHLSSEHLISKSIASVIMQNNPDAQTSRQSTSVSLQSTFAILQNRQNSRGAIGFWQLEQYPDPFVTAHAVMLMLEAKSAGFEVPSSLLSNANQFLSELSQNQNLYDISDLRLRAYAAYLLAKQGEVVTAQVADIEMRLIEQEGKESSDLTAVYLAATYQLLQLDQKAETWLKPTITALSTAYNKAWWSVNYWDPLVIDATRLSLIATHFPQHTRNLPPQVLDNLQAMLNESRFTSLSSAMTVIALARYIDVVDELLNGTIQSKNKPVSDIDDSNVHDSEGQPLLIERAYIDASNKRITEVISNPLNKQLIPEVPEVEKENTKAVEPVNTVIGNFSNAFDNPLRTKGIIFTNKTELPAWYNVTQSGFDYQLDKTAINDGLEISRQYTDADNQPVDHVKLGETLNVTVNIRAISKEGMTKIAIIDLLPGGFEVVEQTVNNNGDESTSDQSNSSSTHYYESNSYETSPAAAYSHDEQFDESQDQDNEQNNASHLEFREDRVLIYTTATDNMQTFNYQIKPTNLGTYQIPAIFVQALYNSRVQAVSTPAIRILNVTN